MAEHHIFRSPSPQGTHDPGAQLGLAHQHLFLVGGEPGEALGLAAGNQGHLLYGVVGLHQGAHQGMAHLVISDQPLAAAVGEWLALHSGDHPVHRVVDLGQGGGLLAPARRKNRRLVKQVGQVGPGEARGAPGNGLQAHVLGQLLVAAVHLENLHPALDVGHVHHHLAVETARSQQGRIEHVGPVGGGDDDDAAVALEAVHLCEQLVEGLLPLVVAAAHAGTALAADGVDLIDEDQARAVFLGALEQVAHPAGTHAHEHLHELRAGEGEEGHAGLTGDGLGQQGLAGAGRAHQQNPFGNLGAHGGEALRGLEEGHHLLEVLLGLLHPGHVVELHAGFGLHGKASLGLAELHRLARTTGHAIAAASQEDQ